MILELLILNKLNKMSTKPEVNFKYTKPTQDQDFAELLACLGLLLIFVIGYGIDSWR